MSPARPGSPRRRGRTGAGAGLGGEQVEGRQAVRELLAAGRRHVHEVLVSATGDEAPILAEIEDLAAGAGVVLRRVRPEVLAGVARSEVPQGVLARAEPVAPRPLGELAGPGCFLVLLDGVTDPHNLGAILRTASCAGATGVVLARRRAVHLTPTALKAAAGAAEHLAFALVAGAGAALQDLGRAGVWRVGLDEAGATDLEAVQVLAEPCALVLGAEGRGLAPLTASRCDLLARIPLAGPIPSLNVSAAAAVACFTVLRHRQRPA